jgi:hypothetical protein
MTVFWDDVPCSLVEIDQHFRGIYCHLYHFDVGGRSTSEMLVSFYETTWCSFPEDSLHL